MPGFSYINEVVQGYYADGIEENQIDLFSPSPW